MCHTYFIADLHLSADRPDITRCFADFMQNDAPSAEALYILGDLFEVWLGDDDINPFTQQITDIIAALSAQIPVYFIHGNRDFGIRKGWAKRAGVTLLPEQYAFELYGNKTLISHGDELCTLDIEYQKFRRRSRSWWWPRLMLSIPLPLRRKIAANGRKKSKQKQQHLAQEIMDVTPGEVIKAMEKYQVTQFIHGHTHRPNIHAVELSSGSARRIVVGDWYQQGSVLRISPTSIDLQKRPFCSTPTD